MPNEHLDPLTTAPAPKLDAAVDQQNMPSGHTHSSLSPIEPTAAPSKPVKRVVELAVGDTLGPYRVEKKLGEGGMGSVYKARHEHLDKSFAVKVLPPAVTENPDAIARFRREMKAVGKVTHPHIVSATDAGEANGVHYLAMEFVDGTDLQQLVRSRGPLSAAEACEATRQAALALLAAHGAGLVHRDVKPSNLLLAKVEGLGSMVEVKARPRLSSPQPSTSSCWIWDWLG